MKTPPELVSRGVGTAVEYKPNVKHTAVNTESVVLVKPSSISLETLQPNYLPRWRGNKFDEMEYSPEELPIQWSSVPGESLINEAEKKLEREELKDEKEKATLQKRKSMQKRLQKRQRDRAREKARRQKKVGTGETNKRTRGLKPKKRYKVKPFADTCTPRYVPRA